MTDHTTRLVVATAAVAAAVILPGSAVAAVEPRDSAAQEAEAAAKFVPGEVLVGFRPAIGGGERAAVRREEDVSPEEALPVPGLEKVDTDRGTSVGEAVRQLEDRPEVAYAQPNFVRHVAVQPGPGETLFDDLWGLQRIDAPSAWDITTGSDDATVGVVDSGVDYGHPDLAGNVSGGRDFCSVTLPQAPYCQQDAQGVTRQDPDPRDEHGHGTHVAGTIGADGLNGAGLPGVNWDVNLLPVKVANAGGTTTDSVLAEGFAYAADQRARVVNASFGAKGGAAAPALQQAVSESPGTLFVVAAGNGDGIPSNGPEQINNDQNPDFLCNIPADNLLCVTAGTQGDQLADFANYGVRSVDVAAPGVGVLSTVRGLSTELDEDFETNPFAGAPSRWSTDPGAPWGWVDDGDAQTSASAIADSPASDYAPSATSSATSPIVDVADSDACRLEYDLSLELDADLPDPATDPDDELVVEALPVGAPGGPVELERHTSSVDAPQSHPLPTFEGATGVRLRFILLTDPVGTADGAQVDDVVVACGRHGLMSGTSMATPHVAGTAALGFAQTAAATPTQMKCALMAGVDPATANPFAFLTAAGGRLDAGRTLELLTPANPAAACITAAPPARGTDRTVVFELESSRPTGGFECRLDGNPPVGCGSDYSSPSLSDGVHTLQVRADSRAPLTDPKLAPTHRFTVDTTGPQMGVPAGLELTRRTIRFPLACPGGELSGPCAGTLGLRALDRLDVGGRKRRVDFGGKQFSIASGQVETLTFRLSRLERRAISRAGTVRVAATANAVDALGNAATTERTLSLSG